jgi:predicted ATPase
MIISRLKLKNWRNFRQVDAQLHERQFLVGPNAAGKSNLLDAIRFLRDIAKSEGGGLQKAVSDRGDIPKVRCLSARNDTEISISVDIAEASDDSPIWRYEIGIRQESRGFRQPYLSFERVWHQQKQILNRPDKEDAQDRERLKQTFLEQVNVNKEFREIARFFESITYLHLVPQLLRYPELLQAGRLENDPFGQGFLERIARTPKKTRDARLRRIQEALKVAAPKFQELKFDQDEQTGRPHLAALYSHWRRDAGWQREDQLSDGTLRLIGLLWSMQEGDSTLLLEEPELSLNSGIVSNLAPLIYRMQRQRRRQVIISTHSEALLNDPGISGEEILMLLPENEGTTVKTATDFQEIRALLEAGVAVGDVVLSKIRPKNISELGFIES